MSHVSGQARRHSCLRAAGLLAGALAIVAGASACSGGSSPAASGLSRQAGTGAGRGTPSGSLAYWLGQVVAGNDTAACEDMAEPLKGSAAPRPNTANACASKSNPSSAGVSALHTNFAADGIRPGNSFRIGAVHIAGKIAGVKATDIHIARLHAHLGHAQAQHRRQAGPAQAFVPAYALSSGLVRHRREPEILIAGERPGVSQLRSSAGGRGW